MSHIIIIINSFNGKIRFTQVTFLLYSGIVYLFPFFSSPSTGSLFTSLNSFITNCGAECRVPSAESRVPSLRQYIYIFEITSGKLTKVQSSFTSAILASLYCLLCDVPAPSAQHLAPIPNDGDNCKHYQLTFE